MDRTIRIEPRLTDMLFQKAVGKAIPLSGTFELSPICNFDCRMCYVRKTAAEVLSAPRAILNKEQWLDIAHQAKKQGMLYLLLTGGEPFLWPDFRELYEELIQMGFLISINSNGSLIDESTIAWLVKNPPTRINITLYGATDATYRALCGVNGMFTKVDAAIRGLRDAGISIKVNCSLTPDNVGDLEQIIRYVKDLDLTFSLATYMFPPLRRSPDMVGKNQRFSPKQAARYREKTYLLHRGQAWYRYRAEQILAGSVFPVGLEEICTDNVDGTVQCRAGRASFWITWDGYMTPCGMMTEPKVDVTDRPFSDAWAETVKNTGEIRLSGVCKSCANQQLCHACAAMAFTETGNFAGIPTYLCEMAEEMRVIAREFLENLEKSKS